LRPDHEAEPREHGGEKNPGRRDQAH
jgi:hypothetical protein